MQWLRNHLFSASPRAQVRERDRLSFLFRRLMKIKITCSNFIYNGGKQNKTLAKRYEIKWNYPSLNLPVSGGHFLLTVSDCIQRGNKPGWPIEIESSQFEWWLMTAEQNNDYVICCLRKHKWCFSSLFSASLTRPWAFWLFNCHGYSEMFYHFLANLSNELIWENCF